jgi:hypothetical protein
MKKKYWLCLGLLLAWGVAQQAMAAQEWSDIHYIEGKFSRIYFDYVVRGGVGTFYCINDWMTNQDDGGATGGMKAGEYNSFPFAMGTDNYEVRIFADSTYQILINGVPGTLPGFAAATSWNTSDNSNVKHTIWEWKFEPPGTTTKITKMIGKDPPAASVEIIITPAPRPVGLITGPSAYDHYIDGEFADSQQYPTIPPVPTRSYQDPVPDPWLGSGYFDLTFIPAGGLIVNHIPVPPAFWLLGSGLACLLGLRKKFQG